MLDMMIGSTAVGDAEPVFVIAEIGVNHDGNVNTAFELVRTASRCGANAVKLQVFSADALLHPSMPTVKYQQQACPKESPRELLRSRQLDADSLFRVVNAIREEGLIPLATPFSPPDVDTITSLKLPVIKVASPDLVNLVLLKKCATAGRPLIVSTGASTLSEVEQCVVNLRHWGSQFALLHCVSSYPASLHEANLAWISELRRHFGVVVGFSDHTTSVHTGAYAVMAGARIVEKHLTLDTAASGPDHACSADPEQFAEYVHLIRQAERLLGRPGKRVLDCEREVRSLSRQSLVAAVDLQAGQALQPQHLTVQRPGTGISPLYTAQAVGAQLVRNVPAGAIISWDMLKPAA